MQKSGPVTSYLRLVMRQLWSGLAVLLLLAAPSILSADEVAAGTPLPGNVASITQPVVDLGTLSPSTQMGLTLVLSPSAQQNAALTQFLVAVQTPTSPQYHQWLTVQQFAAQYGPVQQEVQQAQAWLTSEGFTVTTTSAAGLWINFTGTAGQVQAAFGVSLHTYSTSAGTAYANVTAPMVPTALVPFVTGVVGLSTLTPSLTASQIIHEEFGTGSGWMQPAQFNSLYDVGPLISAGTNGAGVQIAIVGNEGISSADLAAYRAAAGLAALNVQEVGSVPSTLATGVPLAELELAGAIAPAAQLDYFGAPTELQAAQNAVDQNSAAILLLSRSGCEAAYSAAEVTAYQQIVEQAAAQGITVIAPAGNGGPTACDAGATAATQGAAVAYPASLPDLTAVGGTALVDNAESAWTGLRAGLGVSSASVFAGGGGSSGLFGKPSWQSSGLAGATRDLPDVSLAANLAYPVCVAGSCVSGFAGVDGTTAGLQGTLAASASFAGVVALLDQKNGSAGRLGNLAPQLYSIAGPQPAVFHDVTTGSDAVPCSANCGGVTIVSSLSEVASGLSSGLAARSVSSSGLVSHLAGTTDSTLGYTAAAGYDLATGLGSLDVSALSQILPHGSTGTTTTVDFSDTYVQYGSSNVTVYANISVTATGDTVIFTDNSTGSTLGTASVNGDVAELQLSSTLSVGSHDIEAAFQGDTTYAASSGSATLTVAQKTTTTTVSASTTNTTYGQSVTFTANVNSTSASGTVTFTDSLSGATLGTGSLSGGVATYTATSLATGSHTITATYGGDTNDTGSSGTVGVTITKSTSSLQVQLSSSSITYGTNLTITVALTPNTATGTVTLSDSVAGSLGTITVSGGVAQLSTTTLAAGSHTITATYNGDTNDSTATGTNTLYVNLKTPTLTVTATPSTVAYGNTVTLNASLSSTSASGTITFTDSVNGALATVTVSNGTASLTTGALSVGGHTVTATYNGDTNDNMATGTVAVTVTKGNTVTTLTFSPSPAILNNPVTLTAVISTSGTGTGPYTFTGSVTFYQGSTAIGTSTVSGNQATLTYTFTTTGTYSIYAVYSGDTNWNTSTSSVISLVVQGIASAVTLTSTTGTILAGANVIFTSTISATSAYSSLVTTYPTGQVTYYDSYNGSFTNLGSSSLLQSGLTTASTTFQDKFFLPGDHVITAVYSGNTNFTSATSSTFTVVVQDFSLSANPATGSIKGGASGSAVITVTSLYGFSGSVSFSCLPTGGTYTSCSLSNSTITGGSGSTTLTYATNVASSVKAPTGSESRNAPGQQPSKERNAAAAFVALGLLVGTFRARQWRNARLRLGRFASGMNIGLVILLAAALLVASTFGIAGCSSQISSGGSVTSSTEVTPLGTQTFTVTAVGSNGLTTDSHILSYQVAVE